MVYRADSRPLTQIQEAGGMWPWRLGTPDDDLTHHFEGESIEDHSSNFVSTTASLRVAVEHAAALAHPNSEEQFDENFITYIYVIRPNEDFYNVDASLIFARDESVPDSSRRQRLDRLIRDYTGMEEVVAETGFSHYRVISYAELTGAMLHQHGTEPGSPLFSEEFWASRWISNDSYDPIFNTDTSNYEVFPFIGTPRGHMDMVVNGTQPPVPLGLSCLGTSPDIASSSFLNTTKNRNNYEAYSLIDTPRYLADIVTNDIQPPAFFRFSRLGKRSAILSSSNAMQGETACPNNQYLNIIKKIYDKEFFNILFNTILSKT